jgi:Fibronectin type III domain
MATSIFTLSETYVQRVQNTWPSEGTGTNLASYSFPNVVSNISYTADGSNANVVVNVNMFSALPGFGVTHNLNYVSGYYVTANLIGTPNITIYTASNVATFRNLTKGNVYTFTALASYNGANSIPTYTSNTLAAVRTAPGAPIIGTATIDSNTSANVSFTPSSDNGGNTIIRYTATSNPGGVTANITQVGSGIITVTGLTENQSYTFTVTATNSIGTSVASSVSNSVIVRIFGSQAFTTAGTYSYIPTAGVTSISVVAIGGGGSGSKGSYPLNAPAIGGGVGTGGSGGGLGYKNNYPVTAGTPYTVVVGEGGVDAPSTPYGACGGCSYFSSPTIVKGGGGSAGFGKSPSYTGDGGALGGDAGNGGYAPGPWWSGGSGAGAGGYSGRGGTGLGRVSTSAGNTGAGGGGGSGAYNNSPLVNGCGAGIGSGGGGGTGIFGQGTSGAGGSLIPGGTPVAYNLAGGGKGGSGGGDGGAGGSQYWPGPGVPPTGSGNYGGYGKSALVPGQSAQPGSGGGGNGGSTCYDGGGGGGGAYGGGGAGGHFFYGKAGSGGGGAVRVVWPGTTRQFPTTCVST